MGRSFDSAVCCHVPVRDGLFDQPCLGVVMCQQFWLALSGLWELRFQDQSDTLMVVLSRAFEQGLIGGVLNEYVLEHVGCLWWYTSLVHNLRLHQSAQFTL